jgi:hypothetical protein
LPPLPVSFGVGCKRGRIGNSNPTFASSGGLMGVKTWFAGKVAGPQIYGNTMGPHARERANALANMVFLSHGTHSVPGRTLVVDSPADMKAAGFTPHFVEIQAIDIKTLSREELAVFTNLHKAMSAFVFIMNSNAALNYMRRDNTTKFRNGFGPSFLQSTVDHHLYKNIDEARRELLSYIAPFESAGIRSVLNMDKPASGDALEHFIVRAINVSGATLRYAFSRTGSTGFDMAARPIAEETIKSIAGATQQYGW